MEGATASYYADLLWNTEGVVVCVLGTAGLALLMNEGRGVGAVLLAFPLAYFASIVGLPVRNARTLLPVLPFLYVLAGVAVAGLCRCFDRLERGRVVVWVAALAVFAWMLSFPALRTAEGARRADAVVAVESARRWVEDNVPEGSRVLLESYAPYVDPKRFRVQAQAFLIETSQPTLAKRFDYVIAARRSYGRFFRDRARHRVQVEAYDRLFASMPEVAKFTDFGAEIRIFEVPQGIGAPSMPDQPPAAGAMPSVPAQP
jgi:hypothetical protein